MCNLPPAGNGCSPTSGEPTRVTERPWVILGIVGTVAIAWVYLLAMSAGMDDGSGGLSSPAGLIAAPRTTSWTTTDATLMWGMWAIVMVGMMLPSATPMILLFARRAPDGLDARNVLSGMLLASYDAPLCRRSDEPPVDCGPHPLRAP